GWVLVESGLADIPADLRWLYESGAVTLGQLATVHRALEATTAADLAAAVDQQEIGALPGLNASVERAIADALPQLRRLTPRVTLGRAVGVIGPILEQVRAVPGVRWVEPVGSLRRGHEVVGDLELVASSDHPAAVIEAVAALLNDVRWLHRSP